MSDIKENVLNYSSSKNGNEIEVILKYMGYDCRLKSTSTEERLKEIKQRFDINTRKVELTENWYDHMLLPVLVRHKGEYRAVLPSFRGKGIIYRGDEHKKIDKKTASQMGKTGYCFYKGFSENKITRLGLLKYMLSCVRPREYAVIVLAAYMAAVFAKVFPRAQYIIINNIIPSGTSNNLMPIAMYLLSIAIISAVLNVFRGVVSANMSLIIGANFQSALISRLLKLKPSFFSQQRSGSLSRTIMTFSDISDIFSCESITALLSFILSFVYAREIKEYIPELMRVVYTAFGLILLFNLIYAVLYGKYSLNLFKRSTDMTGFVYELFGGMESVKLNNASEVMTNRWIELYVDTMKAYKKGKFIKHYNTRYMFFTAFLMFSVYVKGLTETFDAAEFAAFLSLFSLFMASVGGIGTVFRSLSRFNTAYTRLEEFMQAETEEYTGKVQLDKIERKIEFSNVSYKYPSSDTNVLENISFQIRKGQKIGITGKSGCGKSTLLKLLLGFEKPDSGRIFIDDTDMNEVDLKSYRKNLGVILQTSKLIPGDIYSNITLLAPEAEMSKIDKVLEYVGVKDDIDNMPMGIHTYISENNMTVSTGQKQRLLLARALLGEPFMLVMDEATNALDNTTQAIVTEHINDTDMTAVIVAHRLSTIKECDRILVIDNKTIAEEGSYEELIKKGGIFYELVKNQL